MQQLLEYLAAGQEWAALTGQPLERALRLNSEVIVAPGQVHRDVCVDEDQTSPAPGIPASISARRLASISASNVSMSGIGKR